MKKLRLSASQHSRHDARQPKGRAGAQQARGAKTKVADKLRRLTPFAQILFVETPQD